MKAYLLSALFFLSVKVFAQVIPPVQWQHCYGGSLDDDAHAIKQTHDGGFIVAGSASSSDGDIILAPQHGGNYDYWITKTDAYSNIIWKKHLGGGDNDAVNDAILLQDKYVIGGSSASTSGDVIGNHGSYDFWIVELDDGGNLVWKKCLGGSNYDNFKSFIPLHDNSMIMCGGTSSNDIDVSGNHGYTDAWLVRTDASANIIWQKCFGGTSIDQFNRVALANDGGFWLAGTTASNDDDVSGNHGDFDGWVVRTDSAGTILWQKCIGGTGYEELNDVIPLKDGSALVVGYTNSTDDDVSGNHGDYDCWAAQIDSFGNLLWKKCYGGSGLDELLTATADFSGGFLLGGFTHSGDGDVADTLGGYDCWLLHIDTVGNLLDEETLGGAYDEVCYQLTTTYNLGYAFTGYTISNDHDVSGNHGKRDYWAVRLEALFGVGGIDLNEEAISVAPNPASKNISFTWPHNEPANLSIYDVAGIQILSTVVVSGSYCADVSQWPAGLYIVTIKMPGENFHCSFVKQ